MHTNRCVRWALALSLTCTAAVAQAATVWVGRFPAGAAGLPEPWRVQQLDERIAPTQYALKTWDGVVAVEAVAERSMALLGRPIDIDLLYLEKEILDHPSLTLPHPRIGERRFVLEPLADIRPELILPGSRASVQETLDSLENDEPPLVVEVSDWFDA